MEPLRLKAEQPSACAKRPLYFILTLAMPPKSRWISSGAMRYVFSAATACLLFAATSSTAHGQGVKPEARASALKILSGNDQEGLVSTRLYTPLLVEVVDSAGSGVAGVKVDFSVTSGSAKLGSSDSTSRTTNRDGQTGVFVRLGDTAGEVVITASLGGRKPVEFKLAAKAPAMREIDLELLAAARKGDGATVEALLDRGADASARTSRGETPLMVAARSNSLETVAVLLARSAGPNAAGRHGITALITASSGGQTEMVRALLDHGADASKFDQTGRTPLIVAAPAGHSDIAGALLANGADVHMSDMGGVTALLIAAAKGHTEIAQALLANGADVNSENPNFGTTPLMAAAQAGHAATVRALLDYRADMERTSESLLRPPRTALMWAAAEGHKEAVEALLAKGADVNAKKRQKGTIAGRQGAVFHERQPRAEPHHNDGRGNRSRDTLRVGEPKPPFGEESEDQGEKRAQCSSPREH